MGSVPNAPPQRPNGLLLARFLVKCTYNCFVFNKSSFSDGLKIAHSWPCVRPPVIFLEPHVRPQESSGPPRPAGIALVDGDFEGRLPRGPLGKPGLRGVRGAR